MRLIWLGHASWRLEIENAVILIDPWLGNPMFPQDRRAEAIAGATHILITHGHSDHAAEAGTDGAAWIVELIAVYSPPMPMPGFRTSVPKMSIQARVCGE